MLCKICSSEKESKFCRQCNADTPTLFAKALIEKLSLGDHIHNLMRSGKKIGNKPIREVEQYVGNKDRDVVSEFERMRSIGNKTRVVHRLWRRVGNIFKKIHEHEK